MGDKSRGVYSQDLVSTDSYYFSDEVTIDRINGGYTLVNPVLHTGEECFNNKELCEGKYTQLSNSIDKKNELYQVTTVESETKIKCYVYQIKGKSVLDPNSENIDSTIKQYLDNWYQDNMLQ